MKIAVVIGVIVLIVAGFFFVYNQGNVTGSTITGGSVIGSEDLPAESVREFNINASRFAFNPAIIKVKEGDRVKIRVQNTDTIHGISIPDFNVRGKEFVEFIATKKGTYTFYCGTYCGSEHSEMRGTFIVE